MSEINRITWWTAIAAVAVVIVLTALTGCKAASAPQVDPRALARASVLLLEEAWLASAHGCLDYAVTAPDPESVRQSCESALSPARELLITAASGVDTWTAADQKNFPCLVTGAARGISSVVAIPGLKLPQVVSDGLTMVVNYAGQCHE